MKFLPIALLLMACNVSMADPRIDAIVRNCERVMDPTRPVCRVLLDRREFTSSTISFAGIGLVDTDAYVELKNSGQDMCNWARRQCTADWNGKKCFAARASWRAK